MALPKILVQLDTDAQPSVFDSVVAVDAEVDQLFRHSNVTPDNVVGLVHGAIFTRGPDDLKHTALFIGGSDVSAGEAVLKTVKKSFFGDQLRVSVMMDSNGCNTTAAAAVLAAQKHHALKDAKALVLAGTGPVGQRVALLLARQGCHVKVASRTIEKAQTVCEQISQKIENAQLEPVATSSSEAKQAALENVELIFAAGAAGIELLSTEERESCASLKVAIDLNAVPPVGIAGIAAHAKAEDQSGVICYGALGVGGTKMKIHRAALKQLFESKTLVLDAEQIFDLGSELLK